MSTLGATKRRKRRILSGIHILANTLGKGVSTIRRWIAKRPELHAVLRVRRHGKQWRIDFPKDAGEFNSWIEQVRQAVDPFARTPERPNRWVESLCDDLGFGDLRREQDIEILRQAMLLKRADAPRIVTPHEDEETGALPDCDQKTNVPAIDYPQWESEATDSCATARMIAGQFNCRVQDVPNYWRLYLQGQRQKNRNFNAPKEEWLKRLGLNDRAEQLLPDNQRPGELVALIGKPRADGKPRVKLYRFRLVWRRKDQESSEEVAWRTMYFRTETIQLLAVPTDEEIDVECGRIHELWPESQHWKQARENVIKVWRTKTLAEAALALVRESKRITGKNLAPLLFRNVKVQATWQSHQNHLELKSKGVDVHCDDQTFCQSAKIGISLREFRNRYTKAEIASVKTRAEAILIPRRARIKSKQAFYGNLADDDDMGRQKDKTGIGLLDDLGRPLNRSHQRHFVDPNTAKKRRMDIAGSISEFLKLTPEERRAIENQIGPIEKYISNPFNEIPR